MGGAFVGRNACLDLIELLSASGGVLGALYVFGRLTGSILGMEVGHEGFLGGLMK